MKYRIVKLKENGKYSTEKNVYCLGGWDWREFGCLCFTKLGAKRQILKDVKKSNKEDKVVKEFEF